MPSEEQKTTTMKSEERVQVFVRLRPENEQENGSETNRNSMLVSSSSGNPNKPTRSVFQLNDTALSVVPPESTASKPKVSMGLQGEWDNRKRPPLHPSEQLTRRSSITTMEDKTFTFDRIFDENASQEDIYTFVSAHVEATVRGYNTTIFAYGSTGSGKSFTMTGERSAPGVIPRVITDIFNLIKTNTAADADVHFLVRMSYVELYNNNFRNLLEFASKEQPNSQNVNGHSHNGHHNTKRPSLSSDDLREDHLKGSRNGHEQNKSNAKRRSSFDSLGRLSVDVDVMGDSFSNVNSEKSVHNNDNFSSFSPPRGNNNSNNNNNYRRAFGSGYSSDGFSLTPRSEGSGDLLTQAMSPSYASAGQGIGRTGSWSEEQYSPPKNTDKIEVRESPSTGVFLAGFNLRIPVTRAEEALLLVQKGNKLRSVGATQCNDVSSRSHAILTLHVESESIGSSIGNTGEKVRLGKMHLVDLAGSERLTMSGAEGETLVETQAINLSLTALGDVLSALSRNSQVLASTQHLASPTGRLNIQKVQLAAVPVPYRNSKLTHLLKDSLGGNSKTIMIANIRTSAEYYQQTAVTLMYASRAKKIKNKTHVNRTSAVGDLGIQAVTREIERLKHRLEDRSNEFERLRHTQLIDATEKEALKERLRQLQDANDEEKKQLEKQMSHVIHSQAGQLASQQQKISTLQESLENELVVSHNRIAEQEVEIKWLKKALTTEKATKANAVESDAMASSPHVEALTSTVAALKAEVLALKTQLSQEQQQVFTMKVLLDQTKRTLQQTKESHENDMRIWKADKSSLQSEQQSLQQQMDVMLEEKRLEHEKATEAVSMNLRVAEMQIKSMEKELRLEQEQNRSLLQSKDQEADARVREMEADRDFRVQKLEDVLSRLTADHQKAIEQIRSEQATFTEALGHKDAKLRKALDRAKKLETDHKHQQEQLQGEILSLKIDVDLITRAKQEVEKETRLVSGRYEDKLEALRREMEQHDMKSFIDAASRVAAQLRAAIAQKETALKNEMAAMQAQHEGRLREALADADKANEALALARLESKRSMEAALVAHREEVRFAQDCAVEEARQRHDQALHVASAKSTHQWDEERKILVGQNHQELSRLQQTIDALQGQLSASQSALRDQEVAAIAAAEERSALLADKVAKEAKENDAAMDALRSTVEQTRREHTALQAQLAQQISVHQEDIAKLELSLRSANVKSQAAELALEETDKAHRDTIAKLKQQLAQAAGEREKLSLAYDHQTEELAVVRQQLEDVETSLSCEREQTSVYRTAVDDLESQAKKTTAALAHRDQLLSQSEVLITQLDAEHRAKVATLTRECQELRLALQSASESHAQKIQATQQQLEEARLRLQSEHDEVISKEKNSREEEKARQKRLHEALQKQYEETVGDQERAIEALEQDRLKDREEIDRAKQLMETLKSEHVLELKSLQTTTDNEIKSIKSTHENEIISLKDAHEGALRALTQTHEQSLVTLKDSHDQSITALTRDHAAHVQGLLEKHEAANRHLQQLHDKTCQELKQAQEQVCQELRQGHADEVIRRLQEVTQQRDATHDSEIDKINTLHNNQLAEVTARHDRQLAELAANQLAALTAQKEEFIRITQEQQQLQGGKSAELANALSARDQELRELQTTHATAISALEATHLQAMSARDSSHRQAMESLRAELDARQTSLQSQHRQSIEEVEARLGQELRQAHDRIDQHVQEQAALQLAVTAQKDEFNRKTQEQQQHQADEKEKQIEREKEAQQRHERAVASLETDNQRLQEQLQQLSTQTATLTAEIASMTSAHQKQGLAKQEEVADLRRDLEASFAVRLAEELASRQGLHDKAFASSQTAHGKAMEEALAAHQLALARLTQSHEDDKTTWSGENERLQALLNDVEGGRAALGKDKGRLEEELWGMTDRESALSADMKALESTHTAAIAALRKDHDKDQASLKSTHAEAVLALEASHAVLVDSLRLETDRLKALHVEQDATIALLQSTHTQKHSEVEAMLADKDQEIVRLQGEKEKLSETNRQVEEKMSDMLARHALELKTASEDWEGQMASLRSQVIEKDEMLERLKDTHDEAIAQLAVASKRQAGDSEEALAALRESHDVALASLRESQDLALAALRESHAQALDAATELHEQTKAKLTSAEADRSAGADQIRQLREDVARMESELLSARERAEEELRTLTDASRQETEARAKEKMESEEEHQRQIRALEDTLRKARDDSEALLAKNAAAMAEDHQNAVLALATQHTLALTALQEDLTKSHTAITNATVTAYETKLSTAQAAHEAELETLRETHAKAQESVQGEHAAAIEALSSELATWKTSHNDTVITLRQEREKEQVASREAQDETIARLHTQLIAAQAASVDAVKQTEAASERAEQLQLALVAMEESIGQEREAARAATQDKIAQLNASVGQLTQELENERAEGRRKDSENAAALAERMKENEALLAEAGELLHKAQQQYETERTKSDQLLHEKAELEGDSQAQHDQLRSELDKARVDLQDVEVTVETLRNENAAMAEEIAEISAARDAAVALASQQAHEDTQRDALIASHQEALALMTARFDAERTEMEGTLQQANADIARAQTEAAGATAALVEEVAALTRQLQDRDNEIASLQQLQEQQLSASVTHQANEELSVSRLNEALQTQREELTALHAQNQQQALAILTASFEKERKELRGTLKEAKAEILLVQTEAAKVTEEVQRRIEDLTARWEKERAHRTEAEQRLADAVAKTAAITDAHDILQEERDTLQAEVTELRTLHSALQEEASISRKSESEDLAVQLAQFAQQTAQFAQHSQAWEKERTQLVEAHAQALAELHEEGGLALHSARTALEQAHAAAVAELGMRHDHALAEAHRDREAAEGERARFEAAILANGEAAAQALAAAEEKFEERARLLGAQHATEKELSEKKHAQALAASKQELDATKQVLDASKQELAASKQELTAAKQELVIMKQELESVHHELAARKKGLDATKQELDASKQELTTTKQELESGRQELSASRQELDASKQELESSKQELESSKNELTARKQELESSKNELTASKQELESSKQELEASKQGLATSKQELESIRQELHASKQELVVSKQELATTKQELDASKQELESSRQELNARKQELVASNQEVDASKQDLAVTKQELDTTKHELAATKQELAVLAERMQELQQGHTVALTDLQTLHETSLASALVALREQLDQQHRERLDSSLRRQLLKVETTVLSPASSSLAASPALGQRQRGHASFSNNTSNATSAANTPIGRNTSTANTPFKGQGLSPYDSRRKGAEPSKASASKAGVVGAGKESKEMDRLPTELDEGKGKDGGQGPVQGAEERGHGVQGRAGQRGHRMVQTALVFEDPIEGTAGTPTPLKHTSGAGNTTSSSSNGGSDSGSGSGSESALFVHTEEEEDGESGVREEGAGEEETCWKDKGSPTRETRASSRASIESSASSVHSDGEEEPHYDVMKSYHDDLTRTINQTIEGLKQVHSTQLAEAMEAKARAEAAAQQEEMEKTAALEEAKLAQELALKAEEEKMRAVEAHQLLLSHQEGLHENLVKMSEKSAEQLQHLLTEQKNTKDAQQAVEELSRQAEAAKITAVEVQRRAAIEKLRLEEEARRALTRVESEMRFDVEGKKRELAVMSEAMDLKRAEIEALVDRKQQELSLLIKTGAEIEALVAAREGSPEVIRKLIEKGGFSLEARDESGLTPLALSCSSGSSNSKDHLDVARMLLAAGADVNAESARGSRPLHFACLNQNQDMVALLLEFGANVNVKNSFSKTPLFNACCQGHTGFALLLINAGADLEMQCDLESYATPLHGAVRNTQFEIVQLLLARGASPHAKISVDGHTDDEDTTEDNAGGSKGMDVLRVAEILVHCGRNPNGNAFYASINVAMAEAISKLLQDHVKKKQELSNLTSSPSSTW